MHGDRLYGILALAALALLPGCEPLDQGPQPVDVRVGPAAPVADEPDLRPDQERLQGKWICTSAQLDDGITTAIPDLDPPLQMLVFAGDRLTRYSRGTPSKFTTRATFTVDESMNPRHIDWLTHHHVGGEQQTMLIKGIYQIEGDRLHFCIDEGPEFPRPTQFRGCPGQAYFVFRRASR